ncbi:KH domain-containing protein [Candidatus Haliotispira prima]|uniref:RNA-binding protein KhpA n=1 Tax=Candidatus Haliotispira prima TaxID=3034016 RepID=A0ABY8MJN1_9SPIO|nr:KH domain-containing protein [Candidatus Haliotispira prima]
MNSTEYAEFIAYITKSLVQYPEDVVVETIEGERSVILEVRVSETDIGKVVGRQGRIARALRTLLQAVTARQTKRYALEILD